MRQTAAYAYDLPDALIARVPADRRDASRLLVVEADQPVDRVFSDLPAVLRPGDVLVLNETQVIPARLHGRRPGGGVAEVLLLRPADRDDFSYDARAWLALVRPGRRLGEGARIAFDGANATVERVLADGPRVVRFDDDVDVAALVARIGEVPLPPYVGPGDAARAERYQTVFARVPGSVAAPTASLHFTPDVLAAVERRGVIVTRLTLDVGIGTFRPIATDAIDDHVMHEERYAIPAATVAAIAAAAREGRRVVAAGTTVLRALEGAARSGPLTAGPGSTDIFITPGFAFRVVDALLTNFHLPQSTLLVLVCAFSGYERTMAAYHTAIERGYRFFSFGDAMFTERRAEPE